MLLFLFICLLQVIGVADRSEGRRASANDQLAAIEIESESYLFLRLSEAL